MKRILTLAAGPVVALVVPVHAEDILLNGQEGNALEEGVIVTDKATLDPAGSAAGRHSGRDGLRRFGSEQAR